MKYETTGTIAQAARLEMGPDETAWVSKGAIMALVGEVDWKLRIPGGASGAVQRSLSGESLALGFVEVGRGGGEVLVGANSPGQITAWDLSSDGPLLTTRGAFLAAWGEAVDISVTVARRARAAFFGGSGLFLQRLSGRGTVLVHASGNFHERRLGPGERIRVSTGNLAAFAADVDYDIQGVGGVRKVLFGGEGLFMTRLSGPGRVLLQTLKRRTSVQTR